MNANIHLDRGTRIRLATEYIVADTPEEADRIHQSIMQGITTPNYDQYGGATITLASDGVGTRFVGFCAKELSSGIFGFYIIDITHGGKVTYNPFCTGRGSVSNAGIWIAWKDKDFWWGFVPGFVGYPDFKVQIAALAQQVADMLQEMHAADQQLGTRIAQLEARVADLEARPSGGGAELSAQDRAALDRLIVWLGIA